MGDGSELPSTLNYGQAIGWIACSIGRLASRDYIIHKMHHLDGNDFGVEPTLNLVAAHLGWANLDDSVPPESIASVAQAIWQAEKQLYDALCAGRVVMSGQPNWEPAHSVRLISKLECTNIRFRKNAQGVVIAAIKTNLSAFWSTIRFDCKEIEKEWPIYSPRAIGKGSDGKAINDPGQTEVISGKRSPSLAPDIEDALRLIYPNGEPKAVRRQEMLAKIKQHTGLQVSPSTLDRARKNVWPR